MKILAFLLLFSLLSTSVFAEEIDDKLIQAIIICESGGNPNAISEDGCVGLMGINPEGALAEFNNFVAQGGFDNNRWLGYGGQSIDLIHTNMKCYYGWENSDLKGWYLRIPQKNCVITLDLWHIPLEKKDLYDNRVNKVIGEWYLRRLKDHYLKDNYTLERLLASYNGGITKMLKLLKQGKDWQDMPNESVKYVRKVLRIYYESNPPLAEIAE